MRNVCAKFGGCTSKTAGREKFTKFECRKIIIIRRKQRTVSWLFQANLTIIIIIIIIIINHTQQYITN